MFEFLNRRKETSSEKRAPKPMSGGAFSYASSPPQVPPPATSHRCQNQQPNQTMSNEETAKEEANLNDKIRGKISRLIEEAEIATIANDCCYQDRFTTLTLSRDSWDGVSLRLEKILPGALTTKPPSFDDLPVHVCVLDERGEVVGRFTDLRGMLFKAATRRYQTLVPDAPRTYEIKRLRSVLEALPEPTTNQHHA